jgi:hypothetical protein
VTWWKFWRKAPTTVEPTTEARAHLAKVEQRDPKVDEMSRKLRRAQELNQFSAMVDKAFARIRPES